MTPHDPPMTDQIHLRGMVFQGRHGVTEEERAEEQEIGVDLDVDLDLATAGRSDELADTVDYGQLFDACREVVEERSYRLLEAIGEQIAATILQRHVRVTAVRVRVAKPGVPIDGQLEEAGITIQRRR
jgi:7,8-dihydroneopterin aldolase/epimerase/oxygenase